MPIKDIYIDEFPIEYPGGNWIADNSGGSWNGGWVSGGGTGSGGSGGSGGAGGGGGSGNGDDSGSTEWFSVGEWGSDGAFLPLVDGTGVLLMHQGQILQSVQGCLNFEIECQIQNDQSGSHVRCIIVDLLYKKNENKSFVNGILPSGNIVVKAKWQDGHYNYAEIAKVRFRLKGSLSISPWYTLPFRSSEYKEIMLLTIRDGIISVKSFL